MHLEYDFEGEEVCIKINGGILRVPKFVECDCEEGRYSFIEHVFWNGKNCTVCYRCHNCGTEYGEEY